MEPSIEVLEIVGHTPDTATIPICQIDPIVIRTAPAADYPDGIIVNDRISRCVNQIGVTFNVTRWIAEGGLSTEEIALNDPSEATGDGYLPDRTSPAP